MIREHLHPRVDFDEVELIILYKKLYRRSILCAISSVQHASSQTEECYLPYLTCFASLTAASCIL